MLVLHKLLRFSAVLLLSFYTVHSTAQKTSKEKNSLKGIVVDTAEHKNLHYAIVALIDLADSTLYSADRSVEDGTFLFTNIKPGKYSFMVSYPRMADYLKELTITDTSKIDLGKIEMITAAVLLQEVIVRSGAPIRMRGDTLEYTADSFAVRPHANVEELLKRLPGVQLDKDGKITAQGQEVKRVLVDGDEFFSDDPGLATKYLRADAIDKVQVFDARSDQANFTGVDDGVRTKTINLKLKKNKKNGYFGKIAAGSDGDQYYNHEAMGALFNGTKKMSLFGLSSKTGKAGISGNELSKYVGQDYEMIDDGTGAIGFRSNTEYEGDGYYGSGLPAVESGGAHYSNKWNNNKQKLFSNYRIKQINATGWSNSKGTTVLPDGTGFRNNGQNKETSYSFGQKASASFTAAIDSFSTVKISFNGGFDNGNRNNTSVSGSENEKGFRVNASNQAYRSIFDTKRLGANISYQRQFRKKGRTLSMSLQNETNRRNNDSYNYSENSYYDPASGAYKNADTLNQLQQTVNSFESYATRIMYTDRLSTAIGVSVEYGWKTGRSGNMFNVFNNRNGKYSDRVDSLSNDYIFTANTHITGATLSVNKKKFNMTVSAKLFFTGFNQLNNDLKQESLRNFTNLAPQANLTYRLSANGSLSFHYDGQTTQPSTEQLQPLRKSSNRLYVQIGNPDLQPGFNHNASVSYYNFNSVKNSWVNASVSMNYAENAVVTKGQIDAQNRTVSQYINMNGIVGVNGYAGYNWYYKKLGLRPSINSSFGRYGSYSIQNGRKIKNESIYVNTSFSLNYNWKDNLTLGYRGSVNYNIGYSDVANFQTTRNLSHRHSLNTTAYLPLKIEFSSDCSFNFQPKNGSFSTNFNTIQWNASLQKKFLRNEQGVIKFSVNDILNNNTGYNRSVYGSNVYESDRLVIRRYWLLTLAWNFSKSL